MYSVMLRPATGRELGLEIRDGARTQQLLHLARDVAPGHWQEQGLGMGHAPKQLLHIARDVASRDWQAAQRAAQHVAVHDRDAAGAAVTRVHHRARQRPAPLLSVGPAVRNRVTKTMRMECCFSSSLQAAVQLAWSFMRAPNVLYACNKSRCKIWSFHDYAH